MRNAHWAYTLNKDDNFGSIKAVESPRTDCFPSKPLLQWITVACDRKPPGS